MNAARYLDLNPLAQNQKQAVCLLDDNAKSRAVLQLDPKLSSRLMISIYL